MLEPPTRVSNSQYWLLIQMIFQRSTDSKPAGMTIIAGAIHFVSGTFELLTVRCEPVEVLAAALREDRVTCVAVIGIFVAQGTWSVHPFWLYSSKSCRLWTLSCISRAIGCARANAFCSV